jgi:hypothetical protein
MTVHPLNSKQSKKIRKGSMGEKVEMKKQHLKRKQKVMEIKSSATTLTLGKGPAAMEPNAGSSTRIELVEEKEREDSTISNKS